VPTLASAIALAALRLLFASKNSFDGKLASRHPIPLGTNSQTRNVTAQTMQWHELSGDDLLLLGAILKLEIAGMPWLQAIVAEAQPGGLPDALLALRVIDEAQLRVIHDEDFSAIRSKVRFDDSRASGVVKMIPPTPRLGSPDLSQDTMLDAEDPAKRKTAEIDFRAIRPVLDPSVEESQNRLRMASTQVDLSVPRKAPSEHPGHDST